MKSAYDEIMEHIEVTPEMRGRVLERIREEGIDMPARPRLRGLRRYLSAAACLVLLVTGAAVLPRLADRSGPEPPVIEAGYGIEEAASLRELAGLVGFEVTEDFSLPFEPEETVYASYWRELAQIEYRDGEQSADFRKSPGTEDNSGDYTAYGSVVEFTAEGRTVTLKGDGGTYALALWTEGGYACSLRLSRPVSEEEWRGILRR